MKKFALLLMTLMFTIFSFASPSMANEYDEHSTYEHVQIQQSMDSVTVDSVKSMDVENKVVLSINYLEINYPINRIVDGDDILEVSHIIIQKPNGKEIYKEPLLLKDQIINKKIRFRTHVYNC